MKRILGLILAFAIVVSTSALCVPSTVASAEEISTYETEAEILANLGMTDYFDMDTYDPYSYITNREFLSMLNYVVSETPITDYETYAKQIGAIGENESLQKFLYPTYGFAARAILGVLGYGKFAPAEGTEQWYMTQARRIGVLTGSYLEDMSIRRGEACAIIVKLFDAPILDFASVELDKDGYVAASSYKAYEEGALLHKRGIYSVNGLVDATQFTAMYGESDLRGASVSIDGKVYVYADKTADFDRYVGMNCDVYLSKEDKVMSVTPSTKVKSVSVDAEDFIRYVKGGSVKYIEYSPSSSDSKISRAVLENSAAVIVNGYGLKSYSEEDFDILSGTLTLYDNDSNGKYDLVVVESTRTVLIEEVNKTSKTIRNGLTYDSDVATVDIDTTDTDLKLIVERDGKEIDSSELISGEAVDVYLNPEAFGKARIVKIVAGGKIVTGKVTYMSSDKKKIKIDSAEYDISERYIKANGTDSSQTYAPTLSNGKSYTFYISSKGEVIAAEKAKYDGMTGAYLKETIVTNTGFENEYRIKVFEENGEWGRYQLAEKIKFNGTMTDTDKCFDKIEAQKNAIILIKTNDEDIVSEVMTVTETFELAKESEGLNISEVDSTDSKAKYQNVSNYFEGQTSKKLVGYFTAKTKMFAVPTGDSVNEDDFSLMTASNLTTNGTYPVTAYGVDACGVADFMVIETDASVMTDKLKQGTVMLIQSVSQKLNSEGDLVTCISGPYDFLSSYTVVFAYDAVEYDRDMNKLASRGEIKSGDLIRFTMNNSGEINNYVIVNRYADALAKSGYFPTTATNGLYTSKGYMSGTVKISKPDVNAFVIDCKESAESSESLKSGICSSSVKVFICETGGREPVINKGSLSDISKGDYIFVIAEWALINTVVVYK